MSDLKKLFDIMPQVGTVEWIGLRTEKRGELNVVEQAAIDFNDGLIGDHYQGKSRKRQITLIQAEHITGVGRFMNQVVDPTLLRRNIVISGINLLALKDSQFRIGQEVVLEYTGLCHPCLRMETNLGPGGYNAMRGHGGITVNVVKGGPIKIGDKVTKLTINKSK